MTKKIDGVTVYTFEEWKKLPAVVELAEGIPNCLACDGEGEHTCSCGHVHLCDSCDGTGKQKSLRRIYESFVKQDLSALAAAIHV